MHICSPSPYNAQAPSDIVLCITTAIQEMGEDALQQLEARSREVLPNGALMQLEDVPSTPKLQSGTPSFEAVKSLPTLRDSDAAQRFVSLQQAAKALNADTMLPMAAFCSTCPDSKINQSLF